LTSHELVYFMWFFASIHDKDGTGRK